MPITLCSNFVATNGAFYTLAMMGGILIFMTMLKTAGYFASAAVMVTFAYRYLSGYPYSGL